MIAHIRDNDINVHNVTVLRGGDAVLDVDFYPYLGDVPHDVASVTKSITSTLVGIAVDEGLIESVDVPVLSFFPDVDLDSPSERLDRLTLRHLLTMTSGFCSDFAGGEAQLDAMRQSDDAVRFMLNQPLLHEPGEHFAYCSGASQLLSAVVTEATGVNAEAYAESRLFGPLGIEEVIWPTDPQGNNTGWGDLFIRPTDLAKIGQLFLQRGEWEGERLVSEAWVDEATMQQVADGEEGYGFRWWVPNSLPGLYEGRGRGGQRLVVWPQQELVVVMIGSGFDPGELGGFIVEALTSEGPLPADPEADARLREQIALAASPPPPGPTAPLPAAARSVSGHRYTFSPNEVGLAAFRFDFDGGDEATFTLTLDSPRSQEFGDRVTTVGLDGRYRITPSSRFDLPVAARGYWEDEQTFRFDYDEFANNHLYDIAIRFNGDEAVLTLSEGTGLFDVTVEATRDEP
ncbi:serine hydrolase domain-containing protein [Rubrivirga sp.]|uniref:serine hydrolase domain-containing protein n=1 Tax=Rubrivirga sp. TaxID=1885344 RepID=UPI003B52739F